MTSIFRVEISGEPSEIMCTQEEVMEWFECLREEYDDSLDNLENCKLNLAFLSKSEIQEINKTFAGKDKPTNVLSFPSEELEKDTPLLGDIAICPAIIKSEALAQNKDSQSHLTHIILHSLLHLAGFDHQDDHQAQKMESIEVIALKKIGIANPY